jgi:hypothetical protein
VTIFVIDNHYRRKYMKTILTLANGAVTLTEESGVFKLNVNESVSLGGGEAAGVVKASGVASVELDAASGLLLGEKLLNSHLPAAVQPLALVIEGVANQALKALE